MNTQEKAYNNLISSCRNTLYTSGMQEQSKAMRLVNNMFSKYRTTIKAADTDIDMATIGLQLKEAVDSIFDPTTAMTEEQKKKFVEKLYKKLENGKKLTPDELQYLRMNDPVTYAKAARVQTLREAFKKQLENAKSKEEAADMYLQNMSRISEDDPAKKELEAAYSDVYEEFKKTENYRRLPETRKEAEEERDKKNGKMKKKTEWEEDKEQKQVDIFYRKI